MVHRAAPALWLAVCTTPFSVQAQTLPLQDCRIESSAGGSSWSARCGTLSVPENPAAPDGKKIQLQIAVVPALRVEALPDPLFVLAGGPGQGASDFYASIAAAFGRIRRDRDIVLVDQRGTGKSNRLDCEFDDESELATDNTAILEAQAKKCLAELAGDPRYYTTSIAVRDLDTARQALGYEHINLYGVSYGTRVAQHYLRRFPTRVRSVVLDGVVPVDLALGPDVAIQAQRALDVLFERCNEDAGCRERFPSVGKSWQQLREGVQREPMRLEMPDPLTAQSTTAVVGAAQLSAAVRLLTYSDETASVLPLLIHRAQVDRQPQSLFAQYLMIKRNTETQIAYGMHFAVACSEDSPRWAGEQVSDEALGRTYLGTAFMSGMRTMCRTWPRGAVDEDFNAPLTSDVPTLLLSGENDPVTPASYGARAASGFKRGLHLVLKGQGHGQLANGCMPRIVSDFVQLAAVAQLDTRCAATIGPAPFMLSTSAPAP